MSATQSAERRSAETPAENTLRLPARRRAVPTGTRLRTTRVPLIGLVMVWLLVPTAVVTGSMAVGWWATTGRPKITALATAPGSQEHTGAAPTGADGGGQPEQGDGQARTNRSDLPKTPDDVKGRMTVQQLLDAFPQVTDEQLFARFGVPADTPTSIELKELAERGNGFDLPALRAWLKQRR